MFNYYLRLAFLSLRRNPVLSALMIAAIAIGIGVCMTMLTLYHTMSADPLAHKSDRVFAVQLDGWDPNSPFSDNDPEQAPWELTWTDALGILRSPVPSRQAAMFKAAAVVQPEDESVQPPLGIIRVTGGDMFEIFDMPFLYGAGWPGSADEGAEQVTVLSRSLNEQLYGGENSVGRRVRIDGRVFEIVGVLDDWAPSPKFYDVNNGAFDDSEDLFIPFSLTIPMQLDSVGNTNCWKDEVIDSYDSFMASECIWIQFWVELEDESQRRAYVDWLDNYVNEQKALGRFDRPLNNRVTTVPDWLEARQVVRRDTRVLVGLSFMFLAVCLFNTIGMLLAKFIGKAPQVGLRRALGASRREILKQHLIETSLIGLAGGLIGLLFAKLGLFGVSRIYDGYERLVGLDITLVGAAVLIAVVSGLVAGLYPTWRICRIAPAAHLKTQ